MDLILVLIIILVPAIAQIKVSSNYNCYKKINNSNNMTGKDVARKILDNNGLEEVEIEEVGGNLTDHYDSEDKVVRLSSDIYNGTSIASTAVAAHECGHAIQDKEGYSFLRFRSMIFPIVNVATSISYWIIFIGFLLELINMVYVGIFLTSFGLFFQVITLPVEFDASKRAENILNEYDIVKTNENEGIKMMLNSAAMTYVAGVLSSSVQILRLLLITNRRD
jgi:uncharacterized protein